MYPTRKTGITLTAGVLLGSLLSFPQGLLASPLSAAVAMQSTAPGAENSIAAVADVQKQLNKKQFQNVKITVDDGVATLAGTVDLYEYKAEAEKRAHKAKGISAIRNEIQVAGSNASDADLKKNLLEKLEYDRVGYGNAFNAIALDVQNGTVTLAGHARTYVDKDSALSLVSTYPGVKDVVDNIQVDPVSIMDDQTRIAVYRAVYSFPSLQKYATDPGKPIRISVQNGNVELYGVVLNKADKDAANIRANAVPNVFSVKNYLQVANESNEKIGGSQ